MREVLWEGVGIVKFLVNKVTRDSSANKTDPAYYCSVKKVITQI